MTLLEIALLALTCYLSSSLTAMIGFGGGSFLIGVILLFIPPAAAIPFHGLIQLVSNGWRVLLFRRHIAWHIAWRFTLLLPFGVAVGLWFFQGFSKEAIQILIGVFVLLSLGTRQLRALREKDLPLPGFIPLGFFVGILNMMVGVVAPILGILMVRRELSKEDMIGTMGFMATIGHLLKVFAFGFAGFRFEPFLPALAAMIPAVMLGGLTGKWLLGRFNESVFRTVFHVMLFILSMKLIFWEGVIKLLPQ